MSSFHPPFITVALIILAVFLVTKISPSSTPPATSSKAPSENASPTPTPSLTPSPTFPTMSPTQIIKTPAPKNSPNISTNLSQFIYPNSKQISISGDKIVLESSDSPTAITNWYKDKIKSLGMSATSFVQTSTNDNVLNKLVGSSGNQQVRVEISKPASTLKVKITIEGRVDIAKPS